MPGMIDGHAHAWARADLERAAQFGVTTEFDMWADPAFAQEMSAEQEDTGAPDRADHFSAINPATTPGGRISVRRAGVAVAVRAGGGTTWVVIGRSGVVARRASDVTSSRSTMPAVAPSINQTPRWRLTRSGVGALASRTQSRTP
jgi:hypothetical protein